MHPLITEPGTLQKTAFVAQDHFKSDRPARSDVGLGDRSNHGCSCVNLNLGDRQQFTTIKI
jgi:hypothetical protein